MRSPPPLVCGVMASMSGTRRQGGPAQGDVVDADTRVPIMPAMDPGCWGATGGRGGEPPGVLVEVHRHPEPARPAVPGPAAAARGPSADDFDALPPTSRPSTRPQVPRAMIFPVSTRRDGVGEPVGLPEVLRGEATWCLPSRGHGSRPTCPSGCADPDRWWPVQEQQVGLAIRTAAGQPATHAAE